MESQQPCYNLVVALLQPCQIVTQPCCNLVYMKSRWMFGYQPNIMVKLITTYLLRSVKCYNSSELMICHILNPVDKLTASFGVYYVMLKFHYAHTTIFYTSIQKPPSQLYYTLDSNDHADALRGLLCSKQCLHNVHLRAIVHQCTKPVNYYSQRASSWGWVLCPLERGCQDVSCICYYFIYFILS